MGEKELRVIVQECEDRKDRTEKRHRKKDREDGEKDGEKKDGGINPACGGPPLH
jgi:hypothetical protein